MANKLSSIKFLEEKFVMIQWLLNRDEISKAKADEMLKQFSGEAEAMHKKEIKTAYLDGHYHPMTSEEYYNETFNPQDVIDDTLLKQPNND